MILIQQNEPITRLEMICLVHAALGTVTSPDLRIGSTVESPEFLDEIPYNESPPVANYSWKTGNNPIIYYRVVGGKQDLERSIDFRTDCALLFLSSYIGISDLAANLGDFPLASPESNVLKQVGMYLLDNSPKIERVAITFQNAGTSTYGIHEVKHRLAA